MVCQLIPEGLAAYLCGLAVDPDGLAVNPEGLVIYLCGLAVAPLIAWQSIFVGSRSLMAPGSRCRCLAVGLWWSRVKPKARAA